MVSASVGIVTDTFTGHALVVCFWPGLLAIYIYIHTYFTGLESNVLPLKAIPIPMLQVLNLTYCHLKLYLYLCYRS